MSCHAVVPKAANVCALRSNSWQSLKQRSEFLEIQSKSHKWVTPTFVVYVDICDNQNAPFFGITVTKRTSPKAVTRNRIKRRLRAAIDLVVSEMPLIGWRVILIARKEAETKEFTGLCQDAKWALRRLQEKIQDNAG